MLNSPETVSKPRLWTLPFVLTFMVSLLASIAAQMVTSLIAKYSISLGASLTLAGTIAALLSFAALAARPFTGIIADRFSRKNVMVVAIALIFCCIVAYLFCSSIPLLMVIRIVHGIGFALQLVSGMALASTFLPDERIGEGLGYFGLASILAMAVGPNIGLTLYNSFGLMVPFYVAGAMLLIGLVVTLMIPAPPQVKAPQKERQPFKLSNLVAPNLLILSMVVCFFSAGNGIINTYLPLVGEAKGIDNVGVFFTAYAISVFLTRPFTGKLLDKRGLGVLLVPSIIIGTIGVVMLGMATHTYQIVLAGIFKAIGQGTATACIQATCVKILGRERAGVASSTCLLGQDLGNAVGPILAGMAATAYGYETMFYLYALVLFLGSLGFYALQCFIQKRKKSA